MRVLLDESLPRQLAQELSGHQVQTVRQMKWQGLKNGELMRRAIEEAFDVFITADQNLEYQQNLARFGMSVVVVAAKSNRIEDLSPLIGKILGVIETAPKGQVVHVGNKV